MGRRRKARKKVATKKKVVVAQKFKCPFCGHDESVECKLDRNINIGTLACRICGVTFQSSINYLSEPIDVFSEWIDDLEAAKTQQQEEDEAEDAQAEIAAGGDDDSDSG